MFPKHDTSTYRVHGGIQARTDHCATLFGVFFSGFHILMYGVRVTLDPGEISEIGIAGTSFKGALMYKPAYRASMPYAVMLILMDGFNLMMCKMN